MRWSSKSPSGMPNRRRLLSFPLEVASMFVDSNFKRYPVVKDGKLMGLISRANVLRAINDHS